MTGFTLLEVLAAVALLAILYTVLARVAIEGLRAEGESKRRLEASLIADERLAATFQTLDNGFTLPPVGHSEEDQGDYHVALDVTPFQPPKQWGIGDPDGPEPMLFAAPTTAATPPLRTVELQISWLEGAEERHVARTMVVVDFQAVAALANAAAGGAAGAGAGEEPSTPEDVGSPSGDESPSELEAP